MIIKVYYDSNLVFDLPSTYELEERLALINSILDKHKDKFQFCYEKDSVYDMKISRVLDKFAYYLCTYQTKQANGKALYKDSEIIRKGREAVIKQKELPLFSFYE